MAVFWSLLATWKGFHARPRIIPPFDASTSEANPMKAHPEDEELVALLAASDTPGVSDALDKLGIPGQAINIPDRLQESDGCSSSHRALRPLSNPPASVGDFIDDVAVTDVVVVDKGSRTDCTVWGDIMTQYTGLRDIAGTVIGSACGDLNLAIDDNDPLFTAGRWIRGDKDRLQVGGVNEPVGIGKVRVEFDVNGVVIVPRARASEVAEVARKIEKSEVGTPEMISSGATTSEAREKLGYHNLHRKD
jgi:regulator of RNase E activity RraA